MSAKGVYLDLRERRSPGGNNNSVLVPARQMTLSGSQEKRFSTPKSRFKSIASGDKLYSSTKSSEEYMHSLAKERMSTTSHSTRTMRANSPREYKEVKAKVNSNCHVSKSPVVRIKKIAENVLK